MTEKQGAPSRGRRYRRLRVIGRILLRIMRRLPRKLWNRALIRVRSAFSALR